MVGILPSAFGLCIVVMLCLSLMAIAYLPIASAVYVVLSPDKKAGITNPWRHWVQFSVGELLLLILTFSIVLAFRNFAVSVIAMATFVSHATGKRAAANAPKGLEKELYCFFFGSMFGWITFGVHGAASQYHRAATRWEIFSSGSWQDSFSVVLVDLLSFMIHGLWGLILAATFIALSLAVHWTLSGRQKGQKT